MKRFGIIGGTFDPIHYAHLYIGYEAKEQLNLDEVIYMPARKQPLKLNNVTTDTGLRYEMVEAAIEPFAEFSISNYEIQKEGLSFTYETLEHFKRQNNVKDEENELFFITGADCLVTMEKWRKVERIFELATLVVFPRKGMNLKEMKIKKQILEEKYNGKIIILDFKQLDISSTDIRNRVNTNKRIDFFVPPKVVDIITKNGLYTARNS